MVNNHSIEKIWNSIVVKEIAKFCNNYDHIFTPLDVAEEKFYDEFNNLLYHVNRKYMHKDSDIVDRHKIASIVMIAILKVAPIKLLGEEYYTDPDYGYTFNASLAITTGFSLLVSYMVNDIKNDDLLQDDEKRQKIKELKKYGIRYPVTGYDDYITNLKTELFFTSIECNYNILCLSDKLFWLEIYNNNLINYEPKSNEVK